MWSFVINRGHVLVWTTKFSYASHRYIADSAGRKKHGPQEVPHTCLGLPFSQDRDHFCTDIRPIKQKCPGAKRREKKSMAPRTFPTLFWVYPSPRRYETITFSCGPRKFAYGPRTFTCGAQNVLLWSQNVLIWRPASSRMVLESRRMVPESSRMVPESSRMVPEGLVCRPERSRMAHKIIFCGLRMV